MPEVTIYGASDDLIEVEGYIREEFDLPREGWEGVLTAPDLSTLFIRANFGSADAGLDWTISVHALYSYPDWPIHFTERPGYEGDPAVVIDVPEGTRLTSNGGY